MTRRRSPLGLTPLTPGCMAGAGALVAVTRGRWDMVVLGAGGFVVGWLLFNAWWPKGQP